MNFILLPIVLLLATLLRFYNNTAIALWHDEAFSALMPQYSWGEMFYRLGLDVHPPLYYIVLKVWIAFTGDSLVALRLFSVIFGVLTVWAGYKFVNSAFGSKKLALLSAFFLALNPFQIQYAVEARMYTLGTFLILLSSYLLVRALDNKKYWLWYGIAVAAAIYTHYYLLFSVAAQGLFILLYLLKSRPPRRIKILWRAAGAYLLALILFLPWLKTFLKQVGRVEENYWIPALGKWSVPGTIWKMAFGGQGIRNSVLLAATIVSIFLIIYFLKKVRSFQKWHVFLGLTIPFVAAILISLRTNLYLDRYFVFASLYFVILLTVVAAQFKRFKTLWIITLAIATVFTFFKNWSDLDIKNKPGMAEAARYINSNVKASDLIYVGSSFVYFTFKYYNKTSISPLLYAPGNLESIPHFSGTALLTNSDLITNFNLAPRNSNIYLLWTTGFGGSKPEVPKTWQETSEVSYPDAPGFKGQIFVTKYKIN